MLADDSMTSMNSLRRAGLRLCGNVGALGCAPQSGLGPRRRSDSEDLPGRAAPQGLELLEWFYRGI